MSLHHQQDDLENALFSSTVRMFKTPEGYTRGMGKTVGGGYTNGWAPGAVYTHTDAATIDTLLYVNIGTSTTASWVRLADPSIQFERMGRDYILMYEDFAPTKYNWTAVNDGATGAVDANELALGVLTIATAATDNDYHYYFQNGCSLDVDGASAMGDFTWEAQFNLAEANTDDANLFVGAFDEDHTADGTLLADNGGGPLADWDGFMFYKIDGGTDIEFEVSRATTQESQTMGSFTTATWYRVKLVYDASAATLTPYLDGTAGTAVSWVFSHPKAWRTGLGVKAGDTNAETLKVDYLKSYQVNTSTRRT